MPARVLLQILRACRRWWIWRRCAKRCSVMGGDPKKINPLLPAELVIDHSVQVDKFGSGFITSVNAEIENQRNVERLCLLRWGQTAVGEILAVVPPDTGICHQVNLEYLARVVCDGADGDKKIAYPDSLAGTDSHTTMVNSPGVFGRGVKWN